MPPTSEGPLSSSAEDSPQESPRPERDPGAGGGGAPAGAEEADASEASERTPPAVAPAPVARVASDGSADGPDQGAAESSAAAGDAQDGPVALVGLRGRGLPVGMLSPDECIFSPSQRKKSGGAATLVYSPWQMEPGASFTGSGGSSPEGASDAASDAADPSLPVIAAADDDAADGEADDAGADVPCEIREVDGVLLCIAHAAQFQQLREASAAVPAKRTGSRFDMLTDFAARKELESLCTEVADLGALSPSPLALSIYLSLFLSLLSLSGSQEGHVWN